jgi:hypothetical protein
MLKLTLAFLISFSAWSVIETPPGLVYRLPPATDEISGLVKLQDHLWSLGDSGKNDSRLVRTNIATGKQKVFKLAVDNYDWEAISTDGIDLYVFDIGDNAEKRDDVTIHVVNPKNARVRKSVSLTYPDGPRDVEAVTFIDGQFYLIEKFSPNRIVSISKEKIKRQKKVVASSHGFLNDSQMGWITDASIDPKDESIVLLSYSKLYRISKKNFLKGQSILPSNFMKLPGGFSRAQAEALTITANGKIFIGTEINNSIGEITKYAKDTNEQFRFSKYKAGTPLMLNFKDPNKGFLCKVHPKGKPHSVIVETFNAQMQNTKHPFKHAGNNYKLELNFSPKEMSVRGLITPEKFSVAVNGNAIKPYEDKYFERKYNINVSNAGAENLTIACYLERKDTLHKKLIPINKELIYFCRVLDQKDKLLLGPIVISSGSQSKIKFKYAQQKYHAILAYQPNQPAPNPSEYYTGHLLAGFTSKKRQTPKLSVATRIVGNYVIAKMQDPHYGLKLACATETTDNGRDLIELAKSVLPKTESPIIIPRNTSDLK